MLFVSASVSCVEPPTAFLRRALVRGVPAGVLRARGLGGPGVTRLELPIK